MKITICGSMQFNRDMTDIARRLEKMGYEVEKPNVVEGHVYEDNLDANADLKRGFIDEHFAKIDKSDAILVVNQPKNGIEGYVGGNTLIEIAYAYSQGLDIFLLDPVPEMGYADEIRGMHPIVLGGRLEAIDRYVAKLPLVYMSTESALKQAAVSRAFRRSGNPVRVGGKKVDSGVNEQPLTMEETYEGAMNRHHSLQNLGVKADYYVTVESGQHLIHKNHSQYGCQVIVITLAGGQTRLGMSLDIEYPQEMLDKVPSVYPDLGILVQQEYGAAEKDPLSYITNGRITRREMIENATHNVLTQLLEEVK